MPYQLLASDAARNLGVHRGTIIAAIRRGLCPGEELDGKWYTSEAAAAAWYRDHYRHRGALYSPATGKPWTDREVQTLLRLLEQGTPPPEIAAALKRAPAAIRVKLSKLRAEGLAPGAKELRRNAKIKAERVEAIRLVRETRAMGGMEDQGRSRRREHEGRLRIHVSPEIKAALGAAAQVAGLTLAVFLSRAGLAAARDPSILEVGLQESLRLPPKRQ